VIQQTLGLKPEEFDGQFLEWLSHEIAPIADKFDEWRAHLKAMADFSNKGQKDDSQKEGEAARALYPQYVWDANPYEFLAEIDLAKGDNAAALAVLADYRKFGGEDPETLKKLASLQEEAGQLPQAAATLDGINDIFPIDADLHRRLGALRLKEKNYPASIREYAAVVALHPLDKAGALYELAEAYFEAGQVDDAELNVLGSLEAAAGFRPAQKLLLQIEDARSHRP
jgi:tetratricopeptide (TPR) repeat protein